jgi:hypothetical protein
VVPIPTFPPVVAKVDVPVEVTVVKAPFVANKFVLVAFVTTELVANIFCAKRLRKRRVFVPSEREISVVGRMSARTFSVL